MSKLLKVRLEFDDKIMKLEGDEATKWSSHVVMLSTMAANRVGNQNPFDTDPVKWTETLRPFDARSYERSYLAEQLLIPQS